MTSLLVREQACERLVANGHHDRPAWSGNDIVFTGAVPCHVCWQPARERPPFIPTQAYVGGEAREIVADVAAHHLPRGGGSFNPRVIQI